MYGKERTREQGRQGNAKLWWAVGLTLGLAAIAAVAAIALGLGVGLASEVEREMETMGETAWRPEHYDTTGSTSPGKVEQTTSRVSRREETPENNSEVEELVFEAEEEAPSSVVTSSPRKPERPESRPSEFSARQVSTNIEAVPPRFITTTPHQETTTAPRRTTSSPRFEVETPSRVTAPPPRESSTEKHFDPSLRQEIVLANLRQVGTPPLREAVRQSTTQRTTSEPVTRRPSPRFELKPTIPTVVNNHLDDLSYPLDSIIGKLSQY